MVKTRFAPSPTGKLHMGSLRTAAYAYALAKHENGKFVLRIEDTDKKREVVESKGEIEKTLNVFGLKWDEYAVQSERKLQGIYQKAAKKLISEGNAFYCQCEARNAKKEGFSVQLRDPCRDKGFTTGAIKLKTPSSEIIKFHDFVLEKNVSWNTSVVPDATLLKSDGFPTYHLAVVVDDHDMGITHVLRGHDWMPSTPIHLLVHKFLGYNLPEIGHLTDILDPAGGKLSKRKGSTSVLGMLKEGYLAEAIFNFIILLGWAPKDNNEIFTLQQFVKDFDHKGFQKSNPIFNRDKLDWFNGHYIRQMNDEQLSHKIFDFYDGKYEIKLINLITPIVKDRIKTLSGFYEIAGFFFDEPEVDKNLLGKNYLTHLKVAKEILESLTIEQLNNVAIFNEKLMSAVKQNNFKTGDFFMDLRIAVTGKKFTPPINESMVILGKEESIQRIKRLL